MTAVCTCDTHHTSAAGGADGIPARADIQHACAISQVWLQQVQACGVHVRGRDGLTVADGHWHVLCPGPAVSLAAGHNREKQSQRSTHWAPRQCAAFNATPLLAAVRSALLKLFISRQARHGPHTQEAAG